MPGLLRGIARTAVVAGTASGVAGRVHHRQDQKWAKQEAEQYEQQQAAAAQQAPPAPAAPAPSSASTIDQLKELGELKAQGILTEQEFAEQKAKLLS
ncbi:MAG: SHOCT domain-containing protein [Actinobacteria bacterium]|nr:SHOCT domain-containing protein [Actinomycetota bacterium]